MVITQYVTALEVGTATLHTLGNRSRGLEPRDRVWQHARAINYGEPRGSPFSLVQNLKRALKAARININLFYDVSTLYIVCTVLGDF
jgi:hypothetical protein